MFRPPPDQLVKSPAHEQAAVESWLVAKYMAHQDQLEPRELRAGAVGLVALAALLLAAWLELPILAMLAGLLLTVTFMLVHIRQAPRRRLFREAVARGLPRSRVSEITNALSNGVLDVDRWRAVTEARLLWYRHCDGAALTPEERHRLAELLEAHSGRGPFAIWLVPAQIDFVEQHRRAH